MAVLVEALSVIVPVDAVTSAFPGGLEAYDRECPNGTFCTDGRLTRIGFMAPPDVARFVANLESLGLVFIANGRANQILVVDQITGPTVPCDWFVGGRHPLGYSAGWLKGTEPGPLATPKGWSPDQSRGLTFIAGDELHERVLPLSTGDGLDVVLDFATGRQLYMGRPRKPPSE